MTFLKTPLFFILVIGLSQCAQEVFTSKVIECDLELENGLCLGQNKKVILPEARPIGIISHYSFDEGECLDNTGNGFHSETCVKAGPTFGGKGYSAMFEPGDYLKIPFPQDYPSIKFTFTFWLFLTGRQCQIPESEWNPIIYKGVQNCTNTFCTTQANPAMLVNTNTRKVNLTIQTEAYPYGINVSSHGTLGFKRWTHIAVSSTGKRLKLYMNGILDSLINIEGQIIPNAEPLYIGIPPTMSLQCPFSMLIDELRIYNRDLTGLEIEAEASSVMSEVEPSYVHLGCYNCTSSDAQIVCVEGYHLCMPYEMYSGVYNIIRIMGWAEGDTTIWINQPPAAGLKGLGLAQLQNVNQTFETIPLKNVQKKGLAVCCRDLD